jgi:hypothetical protein
MLWWACLLVVPLLLAEGPVRDAPGLHPAIAAFPVYFLVTARGLDEAASWLRRYRLGAALLGLVLWSAVSSAWTYAGWVDSAAAVQARHQVGAAACVPTAHPLQQPCREGADRPGQQPVR